MKFRFHQSSISLDVLIQMLEIQGQRRFRLFPLKKTLLFYSFQLVLLIRINVLHHCFVAHTLKLFTVNTRKVNFYKLSFKFTFNHSCGFKLSKLILNNSFIVVSQQKIFVYFYNLCYIQKEASSIVWTSFKQNVDNTRPYCHSEFYSCGSYHVSFIVVPLVFKIHISHN